MQPMHGIITKKNSKNIKKQISSFVLQKNKKILDKNKKKYIILLTFKKARMAEQADATDSKSVALTGVRVQVPFLA